MIPIFCVSADNVTLKFEDRGPHLFASLNNMGAFSESCTKKLFEDKGILASVKKCMESKKSQKTDLLFSEEDV